MKLQPGNFVRLCRNDGRLDRNVLVGLILSSAEIRHPKCRDVPPGAIVVYVCAHYEIGPAGDGSSIVKLASGELGWVYDSEREAL